jgi:lipoate-protein ligase A
MHGFDRTVDIAVEHGFDPTIRIAGGRAVVFHRETVRFTWTVPLVDPIAEMQDRFQTIAERVVATLASFDIASSIGELSGEYCPGRYSVHVGGTGKVMGSGQRLARRAAQIAGMIVVRDKMIVNEVLAPIYAALELDMDPSQTGAVADHTDVATAAVMEQFIEQFTVGRTVSEGTLDDATIDLATAFQPDHDPRILA